MLPSEIQAEILALHYGQKKSVRAIARILHINRKSVASVISRRSVNIERIVGKRRSILDPYKPMALELIKVDPSIGAQTILGRLRAHGYMGGYTILREWVMKTRSERVRPREAFLRIDFAPGECAQVDWGEFGDVFGDGVKIHCFVMVLCYSRLMYVEFTRSEKFEEFVRCHENAFKYFKGFVPLECWYDNLATAVTDRMSTLVRFNSRFMAYMGHHAIRPHACNPARGNEKGRVEDGVKYIRGSFWAGRSFYDFDDLGRQAREWLDSFANRREHRSTRKIPALHFDAEEKSHLRPMNPHPFDADEVFSRVVPPNFLISYEANRYSVPWTMVGLTVTVRANDRELKVFYNERFITCHARSYAKHRVFEKPEHKASLLERKPGASRVSWQITAVRNIGPKMGEYLELLRSGPRSLRSEVSKILALSTVYGDGAVHDAARELLNTATIGADNLELLLKARHNPDQPLNPAPLNFQNSRLNRVHQSVDLRRYDALLFEAGRSTHSTEASSEVPYDPIHQPNREDSNF